MAVYIYFANVIRVHDGDTLVIDWDLGRRTWARNQSLRVAGISARELSMPGGMEARDYLASLLPVGTRVIIQSVKVDHDPEDVMSFDRYVVVVQLPDGRDLATVMVNEGLAVWWDGKTKPIPYPAWPIPPAATT